MGGYIAFEIMRQAPERVTRLALLDTGARADTPEQTERRLHQIELARAGRFAEITDQLFPLSWPLTIRTMQRCGRSSTRWRKTPARTPSSASKGPSSSGDSRPALPAIRCPTLVLVGDGDELTPPPLAQEIAAAISGARLKVVEDCGHL